MRVLPSVNGPRESRLETKDGIAAVVVKRRRRPMPDNWR
jgi:hypothetical protein